MKFLIFNINSAYADVAGMRYINITLFYNAMQSMHTCQHNPTCIQAVRSKLRAHNRGIPYHFHQVPLTREEDGPSISRKEFPDQAT